MTPRAAAEELRTARLARVPRIPFTDADPALDERWGYAVQDADREWRSTSGERVIGVKLGLTSRAKQLTMGVHQPIAGFLTDAMTTGPRLWARTSHPRAEPEIAFRLAHALDAPLTERSAPGAVDGIAAAIEIIDSRYAGFAFRLPDVLADNASAAGFVTGPWRPLDADPADLKCTFTADGEILHTATGAAILGDPLRALVFLSEHLSRRDESLPAGSVVLAGALTDAVPVRPGVTYRATFDHLDPAEVQA
ncbi:2-keto-4-pentenoate hydratase [Actinoplanes sp. CA-054009]